MNRCQWVIDYFRRILNKTQYNGDMPLSIDCLLNGKAINHILVYTDNQSFELIQQNNVINTLWIQICDYYLRQSQNFCKDQVDVLGIALSSSIDELIKLIEIIIQIMIESKKRDEFIGVILEMEGQNQEEMKKIVHKIIQKEQSDQQQQGGLDQNERHKFLDKIDELEQENLNLLENLKEFENVKQKLEASELKLEQDRIKMEKLINQQQERTSNLEEESFNKSSSVMRERIKQLEEHYKGLISQKQIEKEQLSIELEQANSKNKQLLIKTEIGENRQSIYNSRNQAQDADKIQEMFISYKADQEELNNKNRNKCQKMKQKLQEEKEKTFKLECEMSGLKGIVMQLEQDSTSMNDKLKRKEAIIEELYERRAQNDENYEIDDGECQQVIDKFESTFDMLIVGKATNNTGQMLDQQLQSEGNREQKEGMKRLKSELKEMKEQMKRVVVENQQWKMKERKAQEINKEEDSQIETLKEELRKQKQENISLLEKQKEENIRLMKEVALGEEQRRDLRVAEEQGRVIKASLREKQNMYDQLYEQVNAAREAAGEGQLAYHSQHGDTDNVLQKLRADVDKYKKHCEVIRKIKVKEIDSKDQELKFLVSVLFDLRTRMNEKKLINEQ